MKTFNVKLYYHGCFETEVEAENEEKALLAARSKATNMPGDEFIAETCISDDGHDIDEVPALDLAERWWEQTQFRVMERVTGLRETDYPDEDGSAAFVEACDAWWNRQDDETKIKIWENNKD